MEVGFIQETYKIFIEGEKINLYEILRVQMIENLERI